MQQACEAADLLRRAALSRAVARVLPILAEELSCFLSVLSALDAPFALAGSNEGDVHTLSKRRNTTKMRQALWPEERHLSKQTYYM